MTMRTTVLVVPLALATLSAGCGTDDSSSSGTEGTRAVRIEMRDNRFVPDSVTVSAGETIRFEFTNDGSVTHDAFIGDATAQSDHEAEMGDTGGHDMDGHDMGDQDAVTVEAGKTGTLTHRFRDGDDVLIGCHQPGHYDGGMKLTFDVT